MKLCQFTMLHKKLHTVQGLYAFFFNKVDGHIRKYDETKYLTFVHSEKFEKK